MSVYLITFATLVLICGILIYTTNNGSASDKLLLIENDYLKFRNNYLLVFLCMMMADWLQGPYVYALYKSYGYGIEEIGILFVVGFLSSAVFGTVISSMADRYGRKKMGILFSIIYTLSCFTKFSNNFIVLLLGRLLGGIATSLLFSVFEAWMVSEHNRRAFTVDLLSETFSKATFGNGIVAIISGLLADGSVYVTGSLVAPFMLSVCFLVAGGIVVAMTWQENYGEEDQSNDLTIWRGMVAVWKNFNILYVGLIVSLFEGCMYTFVFLWGPVLEKDQSSGIPFGLIFATFMVCIMIGSIGYKYCVGTWKKKTEEVAQPLLLLSMIALIIPVFFPSHVPSFFAFNLFELCCGFYFPLIGVLRSKYVPEEVRATVMNLFRVPLNLIVVLVLTKVSVWSHGFIFALCGTLLGIATVCSGFLKA